MMKRRKSAAVALVAILLIAVSVVAYPRVVRFLAVDDWLDRGGSYDYAHNVCDFVRNHPGPREG